MRQATKEKILEALNIAGVSVIGLLILALAMIQGCAPKQIPPGQAKKDGPAFDLPLPPSQPYVYGVEIRRVVDGDTVDCLVYLGLEVYKFERFRLDGIDAWELYSGPRSEREKGALARDAIETLLYSADRITVTTTFDRRGKFGRPIGAFDVRIGDKWIDVEDWLVANGHAIYKEY